MADNPAPAPMKDAPGAQDDTASGDPLVAGLEAARKAPEDADIAADDAGATAMAETMGEKIDKR